MTKILNQNRSFYLMILIFSVSFSPNYLYSLKICLEKEVSLIVLNVYYSVLHYFNDNIILMK